MAREGKQLLFESFEDKKMAMIVGFFCLVYFGVCYFPESGWIAKILPPWPLNLFGIIAFLTLAAQAIVWKLFRHLDPKLSKEPMAWLLFLCEYGLVLFTVTFCTWPIYLFYGYLVPSQNSL
jgi:hypothetical protein